MKELDKQTAAAGKSYHKPELTFYGEMKTITNTNRGGPNFDGGSPPNHKGTPTTGGAFNMDPSYFDDSEQSGSGQGSDVFGG